MNPTSPPTEAGVLLPCKCGAPAICGSGQDLRFPTKPMLAYVAQCSRIIACDAPTYSRETWAQAAKAWNRRRIEEGADFSLAAWHGPSPADREPPHCPSCNCGEPILEQPPEPAEQQAGFFLPLHCLNTLQRGSVRMALKSARHAHFTDLHMRINAEPRVFEADWLKSMVEVPGLPEKRPSEVTLWTCSSCTSENRDDYHRISCRTCGAMRPTPTKGSGV